MKKQALALLLLAAALPGPVSAETLRIITPYIGSITNEYANSAYRLDLKDTNEMDGIYAQWINTEKFQANAFYYGAPNVNYSDVSGLHLNFDYYLKPTKAGKWVAGAGLEDLKIKMTAGRHIAGLKSFDMDNDVLFYYLRAGRYFYFKKGLLDASLLPYAGYAHEKISGEIRMERLFGPFPRTSTIDIGETDNHPLAGLNLSATFAHFIDLQAKWMGRFKDGERLDEYSLLANIYLNRHWGLSYRYKTMEYGSSSNTYNLAGVVYCF
jgi:hypothetical protein